MRAPGPNSASPNLRPSGIVIVEPSSFEVVDVIEISGGQRAAGGGSSARLALTQDEKMLLLREIDVRNSSTLGLGALTVGAEVPRNVEVRTFPF